MILSSNIQADVQNISEFCIKNLLDQIHLSWFCILFWNGLDSMCIEFVFNLEYHLLTGIILSSLHLYHIFILDEINIFIF